MPFVLPQRAEVRPRVVVSGTGDLRPLEDVIEELLEENACGVWRLVGGPGSGKSTALSHLSAIFGQDERLVVLDNPTPQELALCSRHSLVVASFSRCKDEPKTVLVMAEWGRDELIEYILSKDPRACGSVIGRLGNAAKWGWPALCARIVVDKFIEDPRACDPTDVLVEYVREQFVDEAEFKAAGQFCLAVATGSRTDLVWAVAEIKKAGRQDSTANLLFLNERVQLSLAADYLVSLLPSRKPTRKLERRMPPELVELVGQQCQGSPKLLRFLRAYLESGRYEKAHPMSASILRVADPTWYPEARRGRRWNLSGAHLQNVEWPRIDLRKASLLQTDFTGAKLANANLNGAFASDARFDGADMTDAQMLDVTANGAHFVGACLVRAQLANAKLRQADLARSDCTSAAMMSVDLQTANLTSANFFRADMTGARLEEATLTSVNFAFATLTKAKLTGADLRSARLDGVNLSSAKLKNAQLEDVQIRECNLSGASLRNAHLTASRLITANLQGTELCGAGLAEIEWEGADLRGAKLRGATFHMGSSRSGLVGSPIASEGSRTGFYTDDREEVYFKRPEEVRKANLCGADLRGADITGVDFYLVDLRDALLDDVQIDQVRSSGAILEDYVV